MDWIIKYFNITNDTDLIWLVIKAICLCVLLMMFYALLAIIKNILISFFSFSKPKIKNWVVQVEDTTNGKKVHIVWNVRGAVSIDIIPVLDKNSISNRLKVILSGMYASIIIPFLFSRNEFRMKLLLKKNRLKSYNLLCKKLTIPDGSYSFYLNDDNLELTLLVRGIWGIEKSKVIISNAIITNDVSKTQVSKNNTEFSKEFNELLIISLLKKYTASQKRINTNLLNELFNIQFKEKNLVTKGNKLNKLHTQYKSVINSPANTFLKPNRVNFKSNFNFVNHTKEFLNFREHQLNNNQFE